jgi:alpha-2-macroglobulin
LTVSGANASHIRLVTTVEARPAVVPVGPRQHGFSITRTYRKVGPDGSTGPADALEVGDLVAVSLEVETPADARYVVVDDPLPSILEAVNPRFRSQAPAAPSTTPPGQQPHFHWWSDHEELRFDRALFFCNHLWSSGTYRLNYLARVVAEGVVTAPPSKIETMYDPGRYGLSGTQLLSAKQAGDKVAGKDR